MEMSLIPIFLETIATEITTKINLFHDLFPLLQHLGLVVMSLALVFLEIVAAQITGIEAKLGIAHSHLLCLLRLSEVNLCLSAVKVGKIDLLIKIQRVGL
jgi:hypothetical protein